MKEKDQLVEYTLRCSSESSLFLKEHQYLNAQGRFKVENKIGYFKQWITCPGEDQHGRARTKVLAIIEDEEGSIDVVEHTMLEFRPDPGEGFVLGAPSKQLVQSCIIGDDDHQVKLVHDLRSGKISFKDAAAYTVLVSLIDEMGEDVDLIRMLLNEAADLYERRKADIQAIK